MEPETEQTSTPTDSPPLIEEDMIIDRGFVRGTNLAKRLGYTDPRPFWRRVERLEHAGMLGAVMWRRDKQRVTECWLCDFSALRLSVRTRKHGAQAVTKELAETFRTRRMRAGDALRTELERQKAATLESLKQQLGSVIDQHLEKLTPVLDQFEAANERLVRLDYHGIVDPESEPAADVAALQASLDRLGETDECDKHDAIELYNEGVVGRLWWRRTVRRIAFAAELRRLLTTFYCPLRAAKSQLYTEVCGQVAWGGSDRPWRLLPASRARDVAEYLDKHIAESMRRLSTERNKRGRLRG